MLGACGEVWGSSSRMQVTLSQSEVNVNTGFWRIFKTGRLQFTAGGERGCLLLQAMRLAKAMLESGLYGEERVPLSGPGLTRLEATYELPPGGGVSRGGVNESPAVLRI